MAEIEVICSTEIGRYVDSGLLSSVDVSHEAIETTLHDLGESQDSSGLIRVYVERARDLGNAAAIAVNDRANDCRLVVLPIAKEDEAGIPTLRPTYSLNSMLHHELQHIVDFNDPEVMAQHDQEVAKFKRQDRWLQRYVPFVGTMAVSTSVFATEYIPEFPWVSLAVASGVWYGTARIMRSMNQTRDQRFNAYSDREAPLEQRAYSTQRFAEENNTIRKMIDIN